MSVPFYFISMEPEWTDHSCTPGSLFWTIPSKKPFKSVLIMVPFFPWPPRSLQVLSLCEGSWSDSLEPFRILNSQSDFLTHSENSRSQLLAPLLKNHNRAFHLCSAGPLWSMRAVLCGGVHGFNYPPAGVLSCPISNCLTRTRPSTTPDNVNEDRESHRVCADTPRG